MLPCPRCCASRDALSDAHAAFKPHAAIVRSSAEGLDGGRCAEMVADGVRQRRPIIREPAARQRRGATPWRDRARKRRVFVRDDDDGAAPDGFGHRATSRRIGASHEDEGVPGSDRARIRGHAGDVAVARLGPGQELASQRQFFELHVPPPAPLSIR